MIRFLFLALFPVLAWASVEAEFGIYSNFIWRGTTFTENKPAVQGEIDAEEKNGFYVAAFTTNAEFADPAMGADFKVTQEVDYTVGKRWRSKELDVQFFYSIFTFPGARAYQTDEWNLTAKYKNFTLEFSYLDDLFGYQSTYKYVRLGYDWLYKESIQGGLYVGYSMFSRPRGNHFMVDGINYLKGAGNSDYFDVLFLNRKTFENEMAVEFAVNWTNRKEYSVDDFQDITKDDADDFAVIMAFIVPFTL